METFVYVSSGMLLVTIVGGMWRPFKALAIMLEARARYLNALAAVEENKLKK